MAQKLIVVANDDTILIETDFSEDELEEVADKIQEGCDDILDQSEILKQMEAKNYLKVIGKGPDVIEFMF